MCFMKPIFARQNGISRLPFSRTLSIAEKRRDAMCNPPQVSSVNKRKISLGPIPIVRKILTMNRQQIVLLATHLNLEEHHKAEIQQENRPCRPDEPYADV